MASLSHSLRHVRCGSNGHHADTNECVATIDSATGYISNIEDIRSKYYPSLQGTVYLDHAGATTYPNILVDDYAADLKANLFGNPHSASTSSQLSSRRVDELRVRVLRYLNADPDEFDVVFVANATAAMKFVADAFRDSDGGFWYGYHHDAHTSLVGIRELAVHGSLCMTDQDMEVFLQQDEEEPMPDKPLTLISYPGQSNLTGQRYSLAWCDSIRRKGLYSLYDAAALLATTRLDLSSPITAPDFTVVSFYKVFGFPDLGGLIVRKSSADILRKRKYFGGGTIDAASVDGLQWHAKRERIHSSLEDGTLPFHSIVALDHALRLQNHVYGGIDNISRHTSYLTLKAYQGLSNLHHANGRRLCQIYINDPVSLQQSNGPIIAFNLIDSHGKWISNVEVEKLGIVNGIQFRTGGMCNPGGTARHLDLTTEQVKKNYDAGYRCGGNIGLLEGQPTGTVRISFGASSSVGDVEKFIAFLADFFIDRPSTPTGHGDTPIIQTNIKPEFVVKSISVFPIKSCGNFFVPKGMSWDVFAKGLRFDREWCLIHQGTNIALSQKQFPQMALLKPSIELQRHCLTVTYAPSMMQGKTGYINSSSITIDLDDYPENEGVMNEPCKQFKNQNSTICGETILVHIYTSREISEFFSDALGVPCTLARFPSDEIAQHRRVNIRQASLASTPSPSPERESSMRMRTMGLKLSNESPILLISQSSVDLLNKQIQARTKTVRGIARPNTTDTHNDFEITGVDDNGTPASRARDKITTTITSDSFRANIVIAETKETRLHAPYIEDKFARIHIRNSPFDVLGPCQRCQMVCIDQMTGSRRQEPFSTLAKTRRMRGRVWFGMHLCLTPMAMTSTTTDCSPIASIGVGDAVDVEYASSLVSNTYIDNATSMSS